MLLRFGVSNFRSIRDYVEMSFIASTSIKDKGPDLLSWENGKVQVLPAVVVYGANAAGKSSVHLALGAMSSRVMNSFHRQGAKDKIPRTPFALDETSSLQPTKMDCDFVINNVRYHYGFEYDDNQFLREWLYSFPEGHRRMLFNRDIENGEIDFGKHLRGKNKTIEGLLRPNSLFVSTAAQSSHEQLTEIYEFFVHKLNGMGASLNPTTVQRNIGRRNDARLVPFLAGVDTGIRDMFIREGQHPEGVQRAYKAMRASLIAEIGEDSAGALSEVPEPETEVVFLHSGAGNGKYELPFSRESRGTRRLSDVVLAAFQALDNGGALFVDEIDASLHTLLSLKVLSLFLSKETNPNGAQLVTTTHDTNILCAGVLRRDQIWFAEKDVEGATSLYPLTDISTRNSDNLEKGYLQGRFGAIPYFGDVSSLVGVDHGAA